MTTRTSLLILGALALVSAAPAAAQEESASPAGATIGQPAVGSNDSTSATDSSAAAAATLRAIEIQHFRPQDQRGLNVFEAPKEEGVPFTGFKLNWGAAFTQQFQSLSHENTAPPRVVDGVDRNQLAEIGNGFNNATANLYLNAQLAKGIRVALTSYLSSRHHNETWVKDGYLLIDDTPIAVPLLQTLMQYVTVKAGHFEINYGDQHFRRSDNGNAMHNAFVGNLILDAFTTQIGGEVYVRANGLMAMGGITGGEVRGQVRNPDGRSPAFYGKAGIDRQVSSDLRVRLTGSAFGQAKSLNQTLYTGDRAGSRYYSVMDSTQSTESAQPYSGAINPGFRKVTAFQVNPFVKYQGLELFGVIEQAKGHTAAETSSRTWNQYSGEVVYRFWGERLYTGGRYNVASGTLPSMTSDVSVNRSQLSAGWFITPYVLMKGEYVAQKYNDFPTTDVRNGGRFSGFVVEGVVGF